MLNLTSCGWGVWRIKGEPEEKHFVNWSHNLRVDQQHFIHPCSTSKGKEGLTGSAWQEMSTHCPSWDTQNRWTSFISPSVKYSSIRENYCSLFVVVYQNNLNSLPILIINEHIIWTSTKPTLVSKWKHVFSKILSFLWCLHKYWKDDFRVFVSIIVYTSNLFSTLGALDV